FTLIELLVVIIIIAILAAIAIPMYLRQREKSYRASIQSDLRNAAVAAESYYTNDATYEGLNAGALTDNGFNESRDVTITPAVAGRNEYCLNGTHANLEDGLEVWHIGNRDGDSGAPTENSC
ncbi:MAG: prepilin-type N-terminal cleavage/methylation domain-containing protein, partial [Thermoleophilia bacterium]|nr:prepilin-type N-terminal cleavage/methylation domain-containing protein [Thermoleophilia bacterium]